MCNWAVFTAAELFSSWFDYKQTWAHLNWLPVVCFDNLQHPVTSSVRICFTYCFLKTKHSNGRSNLILLFYREKKNSLIQWRERIAWKKGELVEGKNRIICFAWILLFLWILVKFILKHSGASAWSKWVYLECFVSFHFSIFRQRCLLYIDCSFIINSAVYYYFLASRIIEIRKYSMVEFCENAGSGMLMVYSISLFFRDSLSRQVWFLDTAF